MTPITQLLTGVTVESVGLHWDEEGKLESMTIRVADGRLIRVAAHGAHGYSAWLDVTEWAEVSR